MFCTRKVYLYTLLNLEVQKLLMLSSYEQTLRRFTLRLGNEAPKERIGFQQQYKKGEKFSSLPKIN